MPDNIYLPQLARVAYIKEEIGGERAIKTFRVEPVEGDELRTRRAASAPCCRSSAAAK